MRHTLYLFLFIAFSTSSYGQGTLPNPYFRNSMAPWVPDSSATWNPNQFAQNGILIPGGNKVRVNSAAPFNQFFGQGVNVLMLSASGVRDVASRNAPFSLFGAFALNKSGSSFTRSCEIATAKKLANPKANPYGAQASFAWAIPVTPSGNGSGSFAVGTDDDFGIVLRSVESFFLLQKNQVPVGGAAGYLLTSIAPGGGWDTQQVTSQLNDLSANALGYTPAGMLNVAAFAPAGFSKVTFQAKALQPNSRVSIYIWNWGTGCGEGSWVSLPEVPAVGGGIMQVQQFGAGMSIGTAFGTYSLPVANASRFVEATTGTVLVRYALAPKPLSLNQTAPPNSLSVRAFRLQ